MDRVAKQDSTDDFMKDFGQKDLYRAGEISAPYYPK